MTLDQLCKLHGSDKSSDHHNFCHIYEQWFLPWKDKPITLLELGVGGYHHIDRGGGDLRAFEAWFKVASIHAIDIHQKRLPLKRAMTHVIAQDDAFALEELIKAIGTPSIIIDDASHCNPLTIRSFEILFPLLKSGGIYCVEDVHTSYWDNDEFKGTQDLGGNMFSSAMNYFKRLTDALNLEHIGLPSFPPAILAIKDWIPEIASIHFYKELIIIQKK